MSEAPTVADLIVRNTEYKAHHNPIATLQERAGSGMKGPSVAIITCADPRCMPENFLKLKIWDVVVIRTAGANVKTALPSLIAIDELVGLQEVMLINHTDCGAQLWRDDSVRASLKERAWNMNGEIDMMEFGQIRGSLEDRVREHVTIARDSPLLRQELRSGITGYIYDLKSGSLDQVE